MGFRTPFSAVSRIGYLKRWRECAKENRGPAVFTDSRFWIGFSGESRERRVENLQHEIGVGLRNGHRGSKTNDAALQSALAQQQPHFPAALDNLRAFAFSRLLRLAIFHQLDAQHQPFAANVTDELVPGLELLQPSENVVAQLE